MQRGKNVKNVFYIYALNDLEQRNDHYFVLFCRIQYSFRGQLRKSGWLAINIFSPEKCHKVHQHNGRAVLFAAAELLVINFCVPHFLTFVALGHAIKL